MHLIRARYLKSDQGTRRVEVYNMKQRDSESFPISFTRRALLSNGLHVMARY
jgi:hypothetical protein